MGEDGSYDSTKQPPTNAKAKANEGQDKDEEEDSGLQRKHEL